MSVKESKSTQELLARIRALGINGDSLDDIGPDEEEAFPSVGPYECEICRAIIEMKENFVYHVRKYHGDIVDGEVLKSLDRDLLIRKKKKLMQNGRR